MGSHVFTLTPRTCWRAPCWHGGARRLARKRTPRGRLLLTQIGAISTGLLTLVHELLLLAILQLVLVRLQLFLAKWRILVFALWRRRWQRRLRAQLAFHLAIRLLVRVNRVAVADAIPQICFEDARQWRRWRRGERRRRVVQRA